MSEEVEVEAEVKTQLKEYWLDKYRPKSLNQIHGNQDCVKYFKKMLKQNSIRHMIFEGPSGVGKTTSAYCIAKNYLKEHFTEGFIQFNASQQRTAKFIYQKVYKFVSKKVNLPAGKLKICLLDESDNMLKQAHTALLKLLNNSKDIIIFMSCNRVEYIHQSIVERCKVMHFGELQNEHVKACVREICEIQNIRMSQKALQSLVLIAGGDMRIAVNNLQACKFYSEDRQSQIDQKMVQHVCDTPSIDQLRFILKLTIFGRIKQAISKIHEVICQGHSITDINRLLSKLVREFQGIVPNKAYMEMLKIVATELRKSVNLKTELQLVGFLSKISKVNRIS